MTGSSVSSYTRPALKSDAMALIDLWRVLDTETEFMLFEPNERRVQLDEQEARLACAEDSRYVHILVLEDPANDLLAGVCAGRRSSRFRDMHSLHIVIGIRQEYTGRGWGFSLLTELERWAGTVGVCRLELSVMANNLRAIALYERFGFRVEGTQRMSVRLKSGFVDEHVMAKII